MLGQRRGRWANFGPALHQYVVFLGTRRTRIELISQGKQEKKPETNYLHCLVDTHNLFTVDIQRGIFNRVKSTQS